MLQYKSVHSSQYVSVRTGVSNCCGNEPARCQRAELIWSFVFLFCLHVITFLFATCQNQNWSFQHLKCPLCFILFPLFAQHRLLFPQSPRSEKSSKKQKRPEAKLALKEKTHLQRHNSSSEIRSKVNLNGQELSLAAFN